MSNKSLSGKPFCHGKLDPLNRTNMWHWWYLRYFGYFPELTDLSLFYSSNSLLNVDKRLSVMRFQFPVTYFQFNSQI